MSLDFETYTLSTLKNQALLENLNNNIITDLINKGKECSNEELYPTYQQYYQIYSSTSKYLLSMIIIKLKVQAPLGDRKGFEQFTYAEIFIRTFSDDKSMMLEYYSDAIILEIFTCTTETLLLWADALYKYEKEENLNSAITVIKCNLSRCLYSELSTLLSDFTKEGLTTFLKVIGYLVYFDNQQLELVQLISKDIIELLYYYFQSKKHLQGNDLNLIKVDINYFLYSLKPYSELLTDDLQNKFKEMHRFCATNKKKFEPVEPLKEIDMTKIVYTNNTEIYKKEFEGNSMVKVYRAEYIQQKVIVKYYSDCSQDILQGVYNEIQILTYLNKLCGSNPMFLKFYGSTIYGNNCVLIIEDGGEWNLMQYLTYSKDNRIPNEVIENWTISLVRTFASLDSVGITHKDIKPHNILVNFNGQAPELKIIDFSVSDQNLEPNNTLDFTGIQMVQGTKGYMAPEIYSAVERGRKETSYKPSKADVFSLGLTILQMHTLSDYSGWNNPKLNDQLLRELETLNSTLWIKNLLKGMLVANPKSRFSFKACVSFLPTEETFLNY